jgi:ATP-grasp domain
MSASFLVGADGEPHLLAVGWQNVVIHSVFDRVKHAEPDSPPLPARLKRGREVGDAPSSSPLVNGGYAGVLGAGPDRSCRISRAMGNQSREGRFRYGGGRLPAPRNGALGRGGPLAAVRSVTGLRGFVGVDFVWDETTATAEVIEINPRVTTSYVGLARYYGPGVVASAWLGVMLGAMGKREVRDLLSRPVCEGVEYLPDGTVHP